MFESYQVAVLRILADLGGDLSEKAKIILDERYKKIGVDVHRPPPGFPGSCYFIGATIFFTELVKRSQLRNELWPEELKDGFR